MILRRGGCFILDMLESGEKPSLPSPLQVIHTTFMHSLNAALGHANLDQPPKSLFHCALSSTSSVVAYTRKGRGASRIKHKLLAEFIWT